MQLVLFMKRVLLNSTASCFRSLSVVTLLLAMHCNVDMCDPDTVGSRGTDGGLTELEGTQPAVETLTVPGWGR